MRRWASPLLGRILLVNVLPLALLAGLLLSVNQFQTGLLEADVTALREQGHIYAGALGESAVRRGAGGLPTLDVALARPLLTGLMESSRNAHARLYGPDGRLLVDTRQGRRGGHRLQPNDAPAGRGENAADAFYGWILSWLPLNTRTGRVPFETGNEGEEGGRPDRNASSPGLTELPPYIRRTTGHELVITVVEPVTHDGRTVGEIQLTRRDPEVDRSLFAVRSAILTLMLCALGVTVFLSWYLFHTIAGPLRRLVRTSREMREPGHGRADCVPQSLLTRRDEIGILARALRVSTLALWARLDDTERFAAEVSHELKNPLSSIRSALETLPRLREPEQRLRLLSIITEDVQRLERLIADISEASRIEGDLSRGERQPIDIVSLLSVLVEMHETTRAPGSPRLVLEAQKTDPPLCVMAVGDRLVQVLRNLISNALSFSPPDGTITLRVFPVLTPERERLDEDFPQPTAHRSPARSRLAFWEGAFWKGALCEGLWKKTGNALRSALSGKSAFLGGKKITSHLTPLISQGKRLTQQMREQLREGEIARRLGGQAREQEREQERMPQERMPLERARERLRERTKRVMREMVEIVVEDEGPGIPPAKLENIFDRFYSERPGNEHFGQHSGLGLAISRQIVQALDGTIRAENIYRPASNPSDNFPSNSWVAGNSSGEEALESYVPAQTDTLVAGEWEKVAGSRAHGARFIVRLPRCSAESVAGLAQEENL